MTTHKKLGGTPLKTYSDIQGDGGSNILEQVQTKQALIVQNLSGIRHIIAVGSAKGGVGKSTLTMQLGAALNNLGSQVSLLDADVNGPSLARMSGLEDVMLIPGKNGLSVPTNKNGIGVISFGSIIPDTQSIDFESVSKGESYTWRATKEFSVLGDFLGHTEWGELDFLLIDLPPGAERSFQFAEFFGELTSHILVTLPSEVSQSVVSRGIHALGKTTSPILGYIENMSGYYCQTCQEIKPLYPSSDKIYLDIPLLGKVPFDPELAQMCDQGISIVDNPDSPTTKAIEEIAQKVIVALENK